MPVDRRPSKPTSRKPRKRFFVLLVLLGGVAILGWRTLDRPRRLMRQAERLLETNPHEAAMLAEQAVDLSRGELPPALFLWTRALLRSGRRDEALGCFSLISQPSRLSEDELLLLADEALAAGVPLLATFAVDAVPATAFRRPEALERLLAIRHGQGDWLAVVKLGEELTGLAPERPRPWLFLAQGYERQMSPPEAAAAYRQAFVLLEAGEERLFALRQLLRLSIDLGDRDSARTLHRELTSLTTPQPADRVQEARLLRLEGEVEHAWEAVRELLGSLESGGQATVADRLTLLELRGTLAFERGDLDSAEQDFRELLRQQPWNKQGHYKLAQTLQRQQRSEEAGTHFAENRRLTDLSVRILALQGETATGRAEIDRLTELAAAYEALGQSETAARLRELSRQLQK